MIKRTQIPRANPTNAGNGEGANIGNPKSSSGDNGDGASRSDKALGYIKLSNLHWSRYLKAKEAARAPEELIHTLQQSIAALKKCPEGERSRGFAAYKLERLATIYSDVHDCDKAEELYVSSIKAHIEAGSLARGAEQCLMTLPSRIFRDPQSATFNLHRVFGRLLKSKWKRGGFRKDDNAFYDDPELPPAQRAVLLESQLISLSNVFAVRSTSDVAQLLCVLLKRLLAIYAASLYPLRRYLVMLQIIRFSLNYEGMFDEELLQSVLDELGHITVGKIVSTRDSSLSPFQESIIASLRLYRGFALGHIAADDLALVVKSWVSIARDCRDWNSLCSKVEDPNLTISQMRVVADYIEMRGFWRLRISVLSVLGHVFELQKTHDRNTAADDMISCLSQLASQYSRLGYSGKAGKTFIHVHTRVEENNVPSTTLLSWQLAYAEHLIRIEDFESAELNLLDAKQVFASHIEEAERGSFHERTVWHRIVADSAYVYSTLCLKRGHLDDALALAKLSVKLNNRIWVRLDRYLLAQRHPNTTGGNSRDVDSLNEKLRDMTVSENHPASSPYRDGCLYWQHFLPHYSSLLHLSRLSAHIGLYQDATYFADQAYRVAKEIGATSSIILAEAVLGDQFTRGGHVEKGAEMLKLAVESSEKIDCNKEVVLFYANISSLQSTLNLPDDERQSFDVAHKALLQISRDVFTEPEYPVIASLIEKMGHMSLDKAKGKTSVRKGRTASSRTKTKATSSDVQKGNNEEDLVDPEFLQLQGDLLREEARSLLQTEPERDVGHLLDEAERYPINKLGEISQRIIKAEYLIRKSTNTLASHAIYCVLSESTVSLPSIVIPPTTSQQETRPISRTKSTRNVSSASTRAVSDSASASDPTSSASQSHSARSRARPAIEEFSSMLALAKELLLAISPSVVAYGTTKDNHKVSHLLSQVSMLHSATNSVPGNMASPTKFSSVTENGRNSAFLRERSSINADKALAKNVEPLSWPSLSRQTKSPELTYHDLLTQDCLDNLPHNWNVLSLTVTEDHNEIILTRLRADEAPFVLRLPLKRSDINDDEEEVYGFDEGKAELQELIELANRSAHDTRAREGKAAGAAGRAAVREWWKTREALDNRIGEFLKTIESLWFGGFRGVFSQKRRNERLLSRFCTSFDQILGKHLPSRRQHGRQQQATQHLQIAPEVLDLFVKLEIHQEDDGIEDSIMDLLYFVVDILQFHGERNAYDEVDFDVMVMDTLNAIRAYKEMERNDQDSSSAAPGHTILILDKELQMFPWESMDFLRGLPISRVPSLQCLNERLIQHVITRKRLTVDHQKVSYILNPVGDLKSTQATFEPLFTSMPGWSGTTNRDPTEGEFEDALSKKDLLLYFGHGSGAQYIRGRTVRRLSRCAATFLMGCSSGVLTEAGEFEPYGTPMNYLHAGSSALVATLWDVTDKDIDRFTKCALEEWGLIPTTTADVSRAKGDGHSTAKRLMPPEPPSPSRMRRHHGDSIKDEGPVGLDAAISRAREACIFKYLNGAAPVVYGVPVFL